MSEVKVITNFCPHYRVKLFEELHNSINVEFLFFSEGNESFWNKRIPIEKGKFNSKNIKGINIRGFRIAIGLIPKLFDRESKVIVKCIGGKFELPMTFLISKLIRKKFILWTGMWSHPNTFIHRCTFPFTRYIYNKADAIVVYGTHVKDYLCSLGVDHNKIFIAWQTVDNTKFNQVIATDIIHRKRKTLEVNDNEKMILCISRLVEEKGLKYLIEAISRATIRSGIRLVIIGDGELEKELMDLADELGVNIKILRYIPNDEINEVIASCDLFVLPSITTSTFKEPWGLVINEVMNQGKPIVVSDAVGAGVGGLIRDGENGVVFEEKDTEGLARLIDKILSQKDYADYLGINAKDTIKDWTYDRMAAGFKDAIKFVLNK